MYMSPTNAKNTVHMTGQIGYLIGIMTPMYKIIS